MQGVYRMYETGGPEVMRFEEAEPAAPASGEALIRHTAVGLNYIDTYHRSGLYKLPLPTRLGVEAAGIVEAVGSDVDAVSPGDRVAYAGGLGAYATWNCLPAQRLVPLPESISDETAAAGLLKGLTCAYLLTRTFVLGPQHTALVHAAAGGVGLILCQWGRHIGATLIGTVGSREKAELALENGATHVIEYRSENVVSRVRELTGGVGVDVAYDSVGKATFDWTIDSLRPLGMFVSYGNASGPAPDVSPQLLQDKGSLYFTRPTLATYTARRDDLLALAADFFGLVEAGVIRIHINQRYPLNELQQAHSDLEARATTGSTVLLPG